jgi:hypothetical protein
MEISMEEYFAEISLGNSSVLCIGSITNAEAERATDDGLSVDGKGYYLFRADESEPNKPIEVLAKFVSAGAAESLARQLLRMP